MTEVWNFLLGKSSKIILGVNVSSDHGARLHPVDCLHFAYRSETSTTPDINVHGSWLVKA